MDKNILVLLVVLFFMGCERTIEIDRQGDFGSLGIDGEVHQTGYSRVRVSEVEKSFLNDNTEVPSDALVEHVVITLENSSRKDTLEYLTPNWQTTGGWDEGLTLNVNVEHSKFPNLHQALRFQPKPKVHETGRSTLKIRDFWWNRVCVEVENTDSTANVVLLIRMMEINTGFGGKDPRFSDGTIPESSSIMNRFVSKEVLFQDFNGGGKTSFCLYIQALNEPYRDVLFSHLGSKEYDYYLSRLMHLNRTPDPFTTITTLGNIVENGYGGVVALNFDTIRFDNLVDLDGQ